MTEKETVGVRGLASAIVLRAIHDYIMVTNGVENTQDSDHDWNAKKNGTRKQELISFFKSDWCYLLCGLEGNKILEILNKKSVRERIIKAKLGRPAKWNKKQQKHLTE